MVLICFEVLQQCGQPYFILLEVGHYGGPQASHHDKISAAMASCHVANYSTHSEFRKYGKAL